MDKTKNPFILNLSRQGEKVRVSAFEKVADEEQSLKHYEDKTISIADIERFCKEVVTLLNRANRRGDVSPEIVKELKKIGQVFYDEILTPKAKSALRSTTSEDLILYIDDHLVQVPWELLFDGKDFLCLRFNMGRIVSTRQDITGIQKRVPGKSLKMLIVSDPQKNLKAAYKEGIKLRDEISRREEIIKVNLVSSSVDTQYIKKNIRDFDIVHYAGHADHNPEDPSQSGWIMSDGKFTSSDISNMTGSTPLPALVFSNACHSGRTGEWQVTKGFEEHVYGLANAFLLSGATHYIGTFWEIIDSPGSNFAIEFYKAVANNQSVGESIRTARKSLIEQLGEENIIWASYMLYGDPTYRVLQKPFPILTKEAPQPTKVIKEKPVVDEEHVLIRSASEQSKEKPSQKPRKLNSKILYGVAALIVLISIIFSIVYFKRKPEVPINSETFKTKSVKHTMIVTEAIPLELSMNIIGQREDADGNVSEVIIKEGSILQSHDNFQVHFDTNKDAYVYVFIYDSLNKANLLFPDPKIPLDNKVKPNTSYTVPSPGLWFWLDENVGIETIYVLALNNPLDDIKALFLEMESVDDPKRIELSGKLRDKIRGLERGVGGITQGKTKSFYLKDGKKIQKVTEIVKGKASVVRAISFQHTNSNVLK